MQGCYPSVTVLHQARFVIAASVLQTNASIAGHCRLHGHASRMCVAVCHPATVSCTALCWLVSPRHDARLLGSQVRDPLLVQP